MSSSVVTFYSYKGGVGRSFALANIAVILAEWGCRVLAVDWDIEAPGLNHYFAPHAGMMPAGVLDFLADCRNHQPSPWTKYTTTINIPQVKGRLDLMPAAAGGGSDYTGLVQELNWDELYRDHELGVRLEALRASWLSNFDVVLVDSRTGVTDFSGLTTAQLPDVLAFMFTANGQSLNGCADIARRAMDARRRMPLDRPALLPLPIPARFEQREEYDRAQEWRRRFASELAPFLRVWAPENVDPLKLIDLLTIPYVPRWTFGEEVASLLEPAGTSGTRAPSQAASYACETLAALLIQGFAQVDLLVSSRDEYVQVARSRAQSRWSRAEGTASVFISCSTTDAAAKEIVQSLITSVGNELGDVRMFWHDAVTSGEDWSTRILAEIERASALVVVVGPSFSGSPWQQRETEWFLRHSLRSEQGRTVIPVVLYGAENAFAESRLADYHAVFVDSGKELDSQLRPVLQRLKRMRP
jgi:cellulose biosynthesis protein BcsQ